MAKGYDISEFKRRLAKVPAAIRREVNVANEQNAKEWVKHARAAAPKDPDDGTPLHDSIRHHETDTGGQIVRAGGSTTTKPSAGGPYDYALAQEFGTVDQPAQPFFWPTYRLLKKRFDGRRKRALSKAMKVFNNG
jgi:HK97 gp10 family phage protein